jgi:hypothetical protein
VTSSTVIFAAPIVRFHCDLQSLKANVPKVVEKPEELVERSGSRAEETSGSITPLGDEPGFDEHPNVLGDTRTANREMRCDITGAHLVVTHETEDLSPPGFGNRSQHRFHDRKRT